MKRGIFFTIEAVLILGLVTLMLASVLTPVQTTSATFPLIKNTIMSATSIYTDTNTIGMQQKNYYCSRTVVYNNSTTRLDEVLTCSGVP